MMMLSLFMKELLEQLDDNKNETEVAVCSTNDYDVVSNNNGCTRISSSSLTTTSCRSSSTRVIVKNEEQEIVVDWIYMDHGNNESISQFEESISSFNNWVSNDLEDDLTSSTSASIRTITIESDNAKAPAYPLSSSSLSLTCLLTRGTSSSSSSSCSCEGGSTKAKRRSHMRCNKKNKRKSSNTKKQSTKKGNRWDSCCKTTTTVPKKQQQHPHSPPPFSSLNKLDASAISQLMMFAQQESFGFTTTKAASSSSKQSSACHANAKDRSLITMMQRCHLQHNPKQLPFFQRPPLAFIVPPSALTGIHHTTTTHTNTSTNNHHTNFPPLQPKRQLSIQSIDSSSSHSGSSFYEYQKCKTAAKSNKSRPILHPTASSHSLSSSSFSSSSSGSSFAADNNCHHIRTNDLSRQCNTILEWGNYSLDDVNSLEEDQLELQSLPIVTNEDSFPFSFPDYLTTTTLPRDDKSQPTSRTILPTQATSPVSMMLDKATQHAASGPVRCPVRQHSHDYDNTAVSFQQ